MSARSKLLIPNTTQVPNVLLDVVMPQIKDSSLRVALGIVRFTYGFQKQADKISLTQLQNITGLSRQGVVTGVAGLGPLLKIKQGKKGRGANEYSLNLDISTGELVNHFDQSTILTSQVTNKRVVNELDSPKHSISKPKKNKAPIVLPDWLDSELWQQFKNNRKFLKARLSPEAEELALKTLARLRDAGNDPRAVIEQSIASGWRGLFELKNNNGNGTTAEVKAAIVRGLNAR